MDTIDDLCVANDLTRGKPGEQAILISLRLIVYITAAYWLYSPAHQPGSTELYIAIGCLVVSVVAIRLGFVVFRPRKMTTEVVIFYPHSVPMAAGLFLVLAIGFGYLSRHGTRRRSWRVGSASTRTRRT